jgi:hypothetical protein
MQCYRSVQGAALAALLSGLAIWASTGGAASRQPQDEHNNKVHPPAHVPKGLKYPQGNQLKQVFGKPQPADLTAEGGVGISTEKVMGLAAEQHPVLRKFKLELRPRFVTRLSAEEESPVGAEPGGTPAPEALELAGKERLSHFEFEVLYQGTVITKASHSVVVANGKPILFRDRNLPDQAAELGTTESTVKFEAAREVAMHDAQDVFSSLYPAVNPILAVNTHEQDAPRLEIYLDESGKKGTLAWRFSIASTDRGHPFERRYWLTARDAAKILNHEDRIFYDSALRPTIGNTAGAPPLTAENSGRMPETKFPGGQVAFQDDQPDVPAAFNGTHGRVTGTVWKTSPFSGLRTVPLAGVDVTVIKQGVPHLTQTNRFGRYFLPGVAGPVTVQATLAGPFCRVIDESGGAVLSVSQAGQGAVNLAFTAGANEEFKLAQITAFYTVNTEHDYAKAYLPQTPVKLARTPTHVNINQTCNAYWNPGDHSLNFFRSTPNSCPNTAYRDVAFHEYGHGIDDELGGILDGGYSEGFGDSMAVLVTRQPIIGFDFFGPPTGMVHHNLRDASEVHKWPDVQNDPDPHVKGEAYNGFTWELTRQLINKYHNEPRAFAVAKKLILGAAAQNPNDIPNAVRWSFFVDAHIYPGPTGQPSQHYDQLVAAANSRELPIPPSPADLFAEK